MQASARSLMCIVWQGICTCYDIGMISFTGCCSDRLHLLFPLQRKKKGKGLKSAFIGVAVITAASLAAMHFRR